MLIFYLSIRFKIIQAPNFTCRTPYLYRESESVFRSQLLSKIITCHALLIHARAKTGDVTSVREEFKICHPFEIQGIRLKK